jgi:hypothetical protein
METSGPFKGVVGPFRAKSSSCNPDVGPPGAPATQTLASLGLLQPAECAKQAQHAALYSRKRPANPGWRPIHLGQRPISKGLIPIGFKHYGQNKH